MSATSTARAARTADTTRTTRRPRHHLWAALLCLALAAETAAAAQPEPFEAVYDVRIRNYEVGAAAVALARDGDAWAQHTRIIPVGFAAFLLGGPLITDARFAVRDGRIVPISETVTRRSRVSAKYQFNSDNSVDVEWKNKRYQLRADKTLLIESALILQVMLNLAAPSGAASGQAADAAPPALGHYQTVAKGELKDYRFVAGETESLDTIVGKVEARIVDRLRRGRVYYRYWMSPAHNHLPFKVVKFHRSGILEREMTLSGLRWNGTVAGNAPPVARAPAASQPASRSIGQP